MNKFLIINFKCHPISILFGFLIKKRCGKMNSIPLCILVKYNLFIMSYLTTAYIFNEHIIKVYNNIIVVFIHYGSSCCRDMINSKTE